MRSALPKRFRRPVAAVFVGNGGRLFGFGGGRGGGRLVALQPGNQVAQAGRLVGERRRPLLFVGQRLGRGGACGALLFKKK